MRLTGAVFIYHKLLTEKKGEIRDIYSGGILKKEMVVKMDKLEKPGPKVVFIGDPFIDYYPNRQIFSGKVKNVGKVRADFVRVA